MQYPDFLRRIPPVTRNVILICLLIWIIGMIMPRFGSILTGALGLHYVGASRFNPVQVITYMFLHDQHTVLHILFNMFTLWMFGRILEQVWGSRRFFVFYFVCGIGAAIVQECVWALTWQNDYISEMARLNGLTFDEMQSQILLHADYFKDNIALMRNSLLTVGASGAIFGLLLGFAFVFPDLPMYLFFIPIPIKAKYMVLGYAVLEFFLGMNGLQLSVAHFAHLGGMLFGLPMILYWKSKGTLRGPGYF